MVRGLRRAQILTRGFPQRPPPCVTLGGSRSQEMPRMEQSRALLLTGPSATRDEGSRILNATSGGRAASSTLWDPSRAEESPQGLCPVPQAEENPVHEAQRRAGTEWDSPGAPVPPLLLLCLRRVIAYLVMCPWSPERSCEPHWTPKAAGDAA